MTSEFDATYTINVVDVTGHVSTLRHMSAEVWAKIMDSAVTGTPMNMSYKAAAKGRPIQIQWGRNSIARAELIVE